LGTKRPFVKNFQKITVKFKVGAGDGHATGKIMELRSLKENVSAWHLAVNDIKERRKKGHLVWDKDDNDAMMFVSAAANIRASIFHIEQKTHWKVKEMAGNIIPGLFAFILKIFALFWYISFFFVFLR